MSNKSRTFVDLGGKRYSVTVNDRGDVQIWTRWEMINPRTVWSVHPEYFTRSMSISPHGRLGRKILKLAAATLDGVA